MSEPETAEQVWTCPDCGGSPLSHWHGTYPKRCGIPNGPYLAKRPERFVIDQHGYAWAIWPDGTWSMVVSTPLNYASDAIATYEPAGAAG